MRLPRRLRGAAAAGMAAATAMSRVTGFVRTMALASVLGVGTVSDAYNTANTVPNMLFALTAGGVLGSALVPMLTRETDDERRRQTASVLLGVATAATLIVGLAMALAAPPIIRALTVGAAGRPDDDLLMGLGTSWLRQFAPQIALYAISVTATGVMTAHGRLVLGAAAPIATNVLTIGALAAYAALRSFGGGPTDASVAALGWGTTLAVGAMAAIQLWGARRVLPGLRFSLDRHHPAVRELSRLGPWVLLYVAVNQLGLAAVLAIGSDLRGAVTAYQWAFMLMQLPYALIAVSLFSAAYPAIAREAGAGRSVTDLVRRSARSATVLLLPVAVAFVVRGPVIAAVVVDDASGLVGAAVRGFGVSLVPFSLFQLLTRASYAHGDTKTPALVNVVATASMVAVDLVALGLGAGHSRVFALAVGHAISYCVACLLLGRRLMKTGLLRPAWPGRGLAVAVIGAALAIVAVTVLVPGERPAGRLVAAGWSVGALVVAASVAALATAADVLWRSRVTT